MKSEDTSYPQQTAALSLSEPDTSNLQPQVVLFELLRTKNTLNYI